MKLNKKDLRNLIDLLDACETSAYSDGGMMPSSWTACAPVDAWTTGSGRYTKARALPPACCAVDRDSKTGTIAEAMARGEFFRRNPRRRRVIVCDVAKIVCLLEDIVETPANLGLREELRGALREMYKEAAA